MEGIMKNIGWCITLGTILFFSTYLAYADPTSATVEFKGEKGKTTVMFSGEEIKRAKTNPQVVIDKLETSGARCCAPRQKISKCVYSCCDGNQVRTCDKTLGEALSE